MLLVKNNVKAILGAATIGSLALTDPSYAAVQTFTGNVFANPRGGSVQVQITVDAGKITAITTPVSPGGGNSQYTNYAVPVLVQEALAAQSATINGVSGASQISAAWKQSLASAISKAGSAITKSTSAPSVLPTPVATPTRPAFIGGDDEGRGYENEHEDGEGSDDGYRAPRPKRSRIATIKPTSIRTPTSTPSASTSANSLGLTMGAGVIKKTITCVKGKQIKTVKALRPQCPTGFTLKNK